MTPRGAGRAIQAYGSPPSPSVPQKRVEWPEGVCVTLASRKVTTPPRVVGARRRPRRRTTVVPRELSR